MSERYSRIYSLPENLYATGSPVVIAAGALLKDTQNGRMLVQLKFCNVQNSEIKAVKVRLMLKDTAGRLLGEQDHSMLDLNAKRNEMFGQKAVATLESKETRVFDVCVTEVVFADQTVWKAETTARWASAISVVSLQDHFRDEELVKQYRLRFGEDDLYYPTKGDELWHCTCGTFNLAGDTHCCKCRRAFKDLTDATEADLRAEIDRTKLQRKEAIKKVSKRIKWILVITLPIILAVWLLIDPIRYEHRYQEAIKSFDYENYSVVTKNFSEFDDYKNSSEWGNVALCFADGFKIRSVDRYANGLCYFDGSQKEKDAILNRVDYDIELVLDLASTSKEFEFAYGLSVLLLENDYNDADITTQICYEKAYEKGCFFLNNEYYEKALDVLEWLAGKTDYKDVAEQIKLCKDARAKQGMIFKIRRLPYDDVSKIFGYREFKIKLNAEDAKSKLLSGEWYWIVGESCMRVEFKKNGELDCHDGTYSYWSINDVGEVTYINYENKPDKVEFTKWARSNIREINEDILVFGNITLIKTDSAYAEYITGEYGFVMK